MQLRRNPLGNERVRSSPTKEDMMNLQELMDAARELGKEHGEGAASWYFDGTEPTDRDLLKLLGQLEDCDPIVMDTLNVSPLSGEYAGDMTPNALYEEIGVNDHQLRGWEMSGELDELSSAYEESFSQAYQEDVYRQIYARLGGEIVIDLRVFDEGEYVVIEQLWPRRESGTRLAVLHDEDAVGVRIES